MFVLRRAAHFVAGLALVLASSAHAAVAPVPERAARHAWRFAPAESLVRVGRFGAAQAFLDSALAAARRDGPDGLRMEALIRHGGALAYVGRVAAAEPELREALRLAAAHRDTFAECRALNWLATGLQGAGRRDEAARLNLRLLRLSRALGKEQLQGRALTGLAYEDLLAGHPGRARTRYRSAVKLLRRVGDNAVDLVALTGLGRAEDALGRSAASRAAWTEVATVAHERRLAAVEADALTNLGTLEYQAGNPGRAVEYWTRAYALLGPGSSAESRSVLNCNLARAMYTLGRRADAEALLAQPGLPNDVASRTRRLLLRANLRDFEGRDGEACTLARAVLALGDSLPVAEEGEARQQLARSLLSMNESSAALAQCDSIARRAGAFSTQAQMNALVVKGRALRRLERLEESREALLAARALAKQLGSVSGDIWASLALSVTDYHAGRFGRARAEAARAARQWERWRAGPADFEWREAESSRGGSIALWLALVTLDPRGPGAAGSAGARARAAFTAVQPFKARALEERAFGPNTAGVPVPRAGARGLDGSVLRAGEVLLDTWCGEDTSFVFLVTHDRVRAWGLPARTGLETRLSRLRTLLATPAGARAGVDPAVLDTAGAAIGQWLFGPARAELARAHTLFVAPHGVLEGLPLAALSLGDRLVIAEVPSVATLARLRARAPRRTPARRLLALGTGRDEAGEVLPGAERELAWLAQRYAGVERRPAGNEGAASLLQALRDADVVHVAAHEDAHEFRAWDSALLLGADPADRWLRASQVAVARTSARLAVLASCASRQAGLSSEGVHGIAAAFLAAGTPTVIATHWPVDDARAGEFVRDFYAALDRGLTAGEALTSAQRSARSRPATRHPGDWAGFTLVGDPGTRVALPRAGGVRFPVTGRSGARHIP